ncbi:HAMP domain-containing sensor histidine kinase [Pseudonocardia spinosispora]|uniref:HAMP domain-containing sensor histidine kinase n=1 Tax=Pseudonocardia spinosispora TaxID=103441 RepID=UPI0003F8E547|nr:HAMP domain-containing sensor histidine kinase [Pseudonocardia spinosispora]
MSRPGTADDAPRLRTVSLRRRVVVYSLVVLGIVLVLVSVLAEVFVGIQSRADLVGRLHERAILADQLAAQRVAPDDLLDRLDGPGVQVRLVTPDGTVYGVRRGRPHRGAPGPPAPPPPMDMPPGGPADEGPPWAVRAPGSGPVLRRTLVDGSRLALFGDSDELTAIQRRLSRLLAMLGVGGLAIAGLALLAGTRMALRPLDTMTALARSIAAGDRGRRLAPTRTDTELGRTASAFDDMLDALEGAERQARAAEATARASEERTRQFVADAAHELRTPITGLRAAAEAALSSRATGEERDRLQLLLIREAGRAGRLVEDLLAMAQIDAGLRLVREPVELRGLVEAEVERLQLLAPSLSVHIVGPGVTVSGDPQRLAQVLANLLDNARRHTPSGGQITVTVAHADPDIATVRVTDSGPGVPEADRERIFDRLVRLDEARSRDAGSRGMGGAGLGLAIARGIAVAHGGTLRCTDDSVFELTLPTVSRS